MAQVAAKPRALGGVAIAAHWVATTASNAPATPRWPSDALLSSASACTTASIPNPTYLCVFRLLTAIATAFPEGNLRHNLQVGSQLGFGRGPRSHRCRQTGGIDLNLENVRFGSLRFNGHCVDILF